MVEWRPSFRLVPSRFPPVSLFDRVAHPDDYAAIHLIENLTNQRVREELGEIHLVAPEDRIAGPATTAIMAAFTHFNPEGSRFSDGTYGVYYAAHELETAISETAFHRARFMARTREVACEIDMRCYQSNIQAELTDIRGEQARLRAVYDPDNYAESQRFGREDRARGSFGIVYDSVRHRGGQCAAIFKPKALAPYIQTAHYSYVWDGSAITGWYEKSQLRHLR
jgi:hypothetical protein